MSAAFLLMAWRTRTPNLLVLGILDKQTRCGTVLVLLLPKVLHPKKMLHATDNAKSQEALAKSQDDEDDTAAEATHQSTAVQTEKQPHTAIKGIFKSLTANCTFDDDLGSWQFQTQ